MSFVLLSFLLFSLFIIEDCCLLALNTFTISLGCFLGIKSETLGPCVLVLSHPNHIYPPNPKMFIIIKHTNLHKLEQKFDELKSFLFNSWWSSLIQAIIIFLKKLTLFYTPISYTLTYILQYLTYLLTHSKSLTQVNLLSYFKNSFHSILWIINYPKPIINTPLAMRSLTPPSSIFLTFFLILSFSSKSY